MKRIAKILYLSERQVELLKKEANSKGVTFTEMVRRILDKYLDENNPNT